MFMYRRTEKLKVKKYSNSDFVGYIDSRKSISGNIFTLAGRIVSWKSGKQTLIDTSTMKDKLISCFEAISHCMWIKIVG